MVQGGAFNRMPVSRVIHCLIRHFPSLLVAEFLLHVLSASLLSRQFHLEANGLTRDDLSRHAIKNAVLAVPPVHEQENICRWIKETATLDAVIGNLRGTRPLRHVLSFREENQAFRWWSP
jgi:hypothetical protein